MSEKMLSFEEWEPDAFSIISLKKLFDSARQGMMPVLNSSDEIMEYKDATELWHKAQAALLADKNVLDLRGVWENAPGWANAIRITFTHSSYLHPIYGNEFIRSIPRPTPDWQPKEGEAVFFIYVDTFDIRVGKYHHDGNDGLYYMINNGQEVCTQKAMVKPFDPAKIGLPWDQL